MSYKELDSLYREFTTKLYIEKKIEQETFDEIIDFIDGYKKLKEEDRKKRNNQAQKRYYAKNKEKVRKRNLKSYHSKKQIL